MPGVRRPLFALCMAALIAVVYASGGCGSSDTGSFGPGGPNGPAAEGGSGDGSGGSGSGGSGGSSGGCGFTCSDGGGSGPVPPACTGGGLNCYVQACDGGSPTTLSGTVYDPAGKNPLYNVVVFVPNDPMGALPKITPGTHTCNTCDVSIGDYVAVGVTDEKGHFKLTGVPATTHVPLVVQTGKWRREVFLPKVNPCTDNPVPAAMSRLPRNQHDGPDAASALGASMPQMLLLTGGCDDLGCFMRSMGIDASEFSAPHGGGRLDIYSGLTLVGTPAAGLSSGTAGTWGSPVFTKQAYEYYDISIFSCECKEHAESAAGRQALHDWLGEGGKVFASHYHYTWFSAGPTDFQGVANWLGGSVAAGMGTYSLDTSFPKGMKYATWLQNVGALNGANTIALASVATSVSTVNAPTTRWIYDNSTTTTADGATSTGNVKYLSFLTPIGGMPRPPSDAGAAGADAGPEMTGPLYCGKAVFTDLHTSSSLLSTVTSVPSGCNGATLTPQQAALEFLFFDLSACVAPENIPPPPPPPPMKMIN
jgi:hypothetical protein